MSIPMYGLCCIAGGTVWWLLCSAIEHWASRWPPCPMRADPRWPVAGTLLALLYFGGIFGPGIYCILSRAQ